MTVAPYTLTTDRRPQLGLVVLQADETIEADMKRLLPDTAELLVSRVPSDPEVTPETLAAMEGHLQSAASLFPQQAQFAVVGYGCTSGTATIGAARVREAIKAGTQTADVTEPVSALTAACRHLGVGKIGLLSPYIASVSDKLCAVLAEAGIATTAMTTFDESTEERVVNIAAESIEAAAVTLAKAEEMDAIILSCTNLRTLDVIDRIEAQTGLPVLSSNQALAWHMLQTAGVTAADGSPGRLWQA